MRGDTGMWRATYTPGTWVVLSGPTSLVIMQPASASASRVINSIWEAVLAAASIEELAQRLAAFGLNQMPSFGALFWHQGQMRSLVRGAIKLSDLDSGLVIADGDGVQTWTEIGLGGVRRVRVDMEPVDVATMLHLPLVVGAVTASTIVVDATDAARVRSPQQRGGIVGTGPETPVESGSGKAPGDRQAAEPVPPSLGASAQDESPLPDDGPMRLNQPAISRAQSPRGLPADPGASSHQPRTGQPEVHSVGSWSGQQGFPVASTPPPPPPPSQLPAAEQPGSRGSQPGEPWPGKSAPAKSVPVGSAPTLAMDLAPVSASSPFARPAGESEEPMPADADYLATAPIPPVGSGMLALDCPRHHPNPPEAQRCRRCGAPLAGDPHPITRPALATLRPSSGPAVVVDRTVLIGRAPTARQVSRDELPKMLTVPSPSHDISRNHVQVAPDGWDLLATDLHSTNGTFLIRPGRPQPEPLRPGQPVLVFPGCVLDLGDGATIVIDHPD